MGALEVAMWVVGFLLVVAMQNEPPAVLPFDSSQECVARAAQLVLKGINSHCVAVQFLNEVPE